MSNKPNTEKRVPKGEVKVKLQLSEEQREVKASVYNNDATFVLGNWGSGKTQVAAAIALDMLFKRQVDKIIISRPVMGWANGFLPGTLEDKMYYSIYPIKHCLYALSDVAKIDKYFEDKVIEILSVDVVKGMTFCNSLVIIDEFQDLNKNDFKTFLSRLGTDSKFIFTGSKEQIDKKVNDSCIEYIKLTDDLDNIAVHTLKSNHRNKTMRTFLDKIKEYEDNNR